LASPSDDVCVMVDDGWLACACVCKWSGLLVIVIRV
jgi:hypothetical protein